MLLPYHCYNIVLKHVYLILYVYIFYFIFWFCAFYSRYECSGCWYAKPTIHFLCAFCFLDDDSKHCKLQGETRRKKLFLEQHLCRVSCTIFFCFPFFYYYLEHSYFSCYVIVSFLGPYSVVVATLLRSAAMRCCSIDCVVLFDCIKAYIH